MRVLLAIISFCAFVVAAVVGAVVAVLGFP